MLKRNFQEEIPRDVFISFLNSKLYDLNENNNSSPTIGYILLEYLVNSVRQQHLHPPKNRLPSVRRYCIDVLKIGDLLHNEPLNDKQIQYLVDYHYTSKFPKHESTKKVCLTPEDIQTTETPINNENNNTASDSDLFSSTLFLPDEPFSLNFNDE